MVIAKPNIQPGDVLTRDQIIPVLGGTKYAGICPSVEMKTVVIYSDEKAGAEFGYKDGWVPADDDDDVPGGRIFEYTGAGTVGDQSFEGRMGAPNKALLNHADAGRSLHLFVAAGKVPGSDTTLQRYIGQFTINERCSHVIRAARDKDHELRLVIVFRLQPIGTAYFDPHDEVPPAPATKIDRVPASGTLAKLIRPERGKTSASTRAGTRATQAVRREAELSAMLEQQLTIAKHHVARYQIHIKGSFVRLLTDLYDETAHSLYELKGDSSRESVRMALGQLFDYCRFVEPATHNEGPMKLVVALPEPPDDDLQELLSERGVLLTYPVDGQFIGLPT